MIQTQSSIKIPNWEYWPPMMVVRSGLYFIFLGASIFFHSICSLFVWPLSVEQRFAFISVWGRYNVAMLHYLCGVRYHILGVEHIPKKNGIVLSNHQSTWETLAFQFIFPRQTWIFKKELLNIPFMGWAVRLLKPIAIDRSAKRKALDQIMQQGKERLKGGAWLIVFPEGTRVAPGETKKYGKGGARLAVATGMPIVPVAHNAGECWARRKFSIKPGLVTVKIGKPIKTKSRSVDDVQHEVETWIRQSVKTLPPAR